MAKASTQQAGSLALYRSKQDFARTKEPAGATLPTGGSAFVVQKHATSLASL